MANPAADFAKLMDIVGGYQRSRALAVETERIEDDVLIVARFKEW